MSTVNAKLSPLDNEGTSAVIVRSPADIGDLFVKLGESLIERTSPRASMAMALFKDGTDLDDCVLDAVKMEDKARAMWCEKALDPFCKKHGLTRRQAISVAFEDYGTNFAHGEEKLVTLNDLYWLGQGSDFSRALLKLMALEST